MHNLSIFAVLAIGIDCLTTLLKQMLEESSAFIYFADAKTLLNAIVGLKIILFYSNNIYSGKLVTTSVCNHVYLATCTL